MKTTVNYKKPIPPPKEIESYTLELSRDELLHLCGGLGDTSHNDRLGILKRFGIKHLGTNHNLYEELLGCLNLEEV